MPTHNGKTVLPITLEALCEINFPAGGVEIIIVNNASTDNSSNLVKTYAQRLPIRLLETETPGRAHALNLGFEKATGDFVVMTDDDVIPETGWLDAYIKAANEQVDADIFAGQVRHHWQKKPPDWLVQLAECGRSYAGTPVDLPAGPIEPSAVKGPNLAARRRVMERLKFDETLGYTAGAPQVAGEETEWAKRAAQNGYRLWHVPRACVKHIVRPHQIGAKPVIIRYLRIGRGSERSAPREVTQNVSTIFGFPRHAIRQIVTRSARSVALWIRGRRYESMNLAVETAFMAGRAQEWRYRRRNREGKN